MRLISFLLFLTLSLKSAPLPADLAEELYLANINAAIVFTSQDGLSSGVYRFTKIDVEMRMYNLPLCYQFDPFSETMNLFLITDLAYSNTRNDSDVQDVPNDGILNLDNRLQTYVGGIGGGVRYKMSSHSDLSLGAELLYSRVGVSVRAKDGLNESDVINFFQEDFSENFSYKLLLQYDYYRLYRGNEVYFKANYKFYKTFAEFGLESLVDSVVSLDTQTQVASLSVGTETDTLYSYKGMSLIMEPYLKANFIAGDLAKVTEVKSYATFGTAFYWNTPKKSAYIYRYFIEPSVSRGEGLEGLNLSLGFSLDF